MKGSNSVILNPLMYVPVHLNNKNFIYNYNILTSYTVTVEFDHFWTNQKCSLREFHTLC